MNNSLNEFDLNWYYYFSYWVFIWFIIFKLGVVKLSPYFIYLLVVSFIVIRYIIRLTTKYSKKTESKQMKFPKSVLIWTLLILVVDIAPFLLLKRKLDKNSLLFTAVITIFYIIFMALSNKNLIHQYIHLDKNYIGNKFNTNQLLSEIFLF